jgi:hypothetical protein
MPKLTCIWVVWFVMTGIASAQNGPVVIPEVLQEVAMKYAIADRLGIKWEGASTDDIGRYMGFLAAANEVARGIASKNSRETPDVQDFEAAVAALCVYPPNKPPVLEKYWPNMFPAFYDTELRDAIKGAVGPFASTLPSKLSESADPKFWPQDEQEYKNKVLDFGIFQK